MYCTCTVLTGFKCKCLSRKWQKNGYLIMTQRLIKTVGVAYEYAECRMVASFLVELFLLLLEGPGTKLTRL